MSLFSKLFSQPRENTSFSISASASVVEYSNRDLDLLDKGYRQNCDHEIFEPDTVWISPRAKQYYHSSDLCNGYFLDNAIPYPEAEGVRRGLTRCNKCHWDSPDIPRPCRRPAMPAQPVSIALVRPARRGKH